MQIVLARLQVGLVFLLRLHDLLQEQLLVAIVKWIILEDARNLELPN
jgi:hypothetical protein